MNDGSKENDILKGLHPDLRRRILGVARQCRWVRGARNWARFALTTFAATAMVTWVLYGLQPGSEVSTLLICGYGLIEALAVWRWLISPMRNPITLTQVALFIDEHHPELENRVVSALEFGGDTPRDQ